MYVTQKHFDLLRDYLDRKINPEDIANEDKRIVLELCKARKKQLQKELILRKELNN